MTQWHSVYDKLPEDGELVHVYYSYDKDDVDSRCYIIIQHFAFNIGFARFHYTRGWNVGSLPEGITHPEVHYWSRFDPEEHKLFEKVVCG